MERFIDNKLFYITDGQLSPSLSDQSTKYVSLIQNEIFDPNEVNFAAYSEPHLIVSFPHIEWCPCAAYRPDLW